MSDPLEQARVQRAGLRAAIGRVERALAAPGVGRADVWSKELLAELHDLSDALEDHIRVAEEPRGLFDDIIEAAPRLSHRVDRVKEDHVQLRDRVTTTIDALDGTEDSVPMARDRVVELLTAMVRHRHLGADLVYEAYNVDIEAAD